jgi:hypothetical protein
MVFGFLLFAFGAWRKNTGAIARSWRQGIWIVPWFAGHLVIGALGRYGGGNETLPNWVDLLVLIVFALAIFYFAIGRTLSQADSETAVAKDAHQLDFDASAA